MEIRDVRLLLKQLNDMQVEAGSDMAMKLDEAKKKLLTYVATVFSPTVKFDKIEEK